MIIFPEGRRYPGPEMGPFKTGAFKLAAENKIPIIPVVFEFQDRRNVCTSSDNLPLHYLRTNGRLKTRIKLKAGDPITSETEASLLNETRDWMNANLLKMRAEWDQA